VKHEYNTADKVTNKGGDLGAGLRSNWTSSTAPIAPYTPHISMDGLCGPLVNQTCTNSTYGHCCNTLGFCGNATDDCSTECVRDGIFGTCDVEKDYESRSLVGTSEHAQHNQSAAHGELTKGVEQKSALAAVAFLSGFKNILMLAYSEYKKLPAEQQAKLKDGLKDLVTGWVSTSKAWLSKQKGSKHDKHHNSTAGYQDDAHDSAGMMVRQASGQECRPVNGGY